MATVRMSNKLTADLCKEYEKSYENTKPKPEYPASLGDAIYDNMSNLLLTESKMQQSLMM